MEKALYLDHNAGSPLRPSALTVMLPWLERGAANPSSLHRDGQAARAALEGARARVAARLGGNAEDWLFTSGATEACNLALRGAWSAGRSLLVGATEHPAVLETALAMRSEGASLEILPVHADGTVDLAALEGALKRFPKALVALMAANNETGVLHPWAAVMDLARTFEAVLFSDLAQAAGKLAMDVRARGLDLAALSASKFGGPQGSGLLYVRHGFPLKALLYGGHQERSLRPGTENVAGALGLAAALDEALDGLPRQNKDWLEGLTALQNGLSGLFPDLRVHGQTALRVANTLCVSLPGVDRDLLLMRLDQLSLRASAGAACAAGASQASHVLQAMGLSEGLVRSEIRFSFGPQQGRAEADQACLLVAKALAGFQRAGL